MGWKHVTQMKKIGIYRRRDPYGRLKKVDFTQARFNVKPFPSQVLFQPELIFLRTLPDGRPSPAYYGDLPPGSVIQFDEASATPMLGAQSWYAIQNQFIGLITQTQGYRLVNANFVEPTFDELSINVVRQLHGQVLTVERRPSYGLIKIYVFQHNPDGRLWRYWYPRRNIFWRVPPPPMWLADQYEEIKKNSNNVYFSNLALKIESLGMKAYSYYSPEYAERITAEEEEEDRKRQKRAGKEKAKNSKRQHYKFEERGADGEEVILDNGKEEMAFNEIPVEISGEGPIGGQ